MKIQVERQRNMFGKPSGAYIARVGDTDLMASGPNKEQALEHLRTKIERQERNQYQRRYIRANGATFALYYVNGWQYDIVRDEGAERVPSSCMLSTESFNEALAAMERHVAQWNEANCSVAA